MRAPPCAIRNDVFLKRGNDRGTDYLKLPTYSDAVSSADLRPSTI